MRQGVLSNKRVMLLMSKGTAVVALLSCCCVQGCMACVCVPVTRGWGPLQAPRGIARAALASARRSRPAVALWMPT
jgi:hypothetical protein